MRRLAIAVVVALVALASFGVGSALARIFEPYTQPGEWFSPGEAYGSVYDHGCAPWVQNNFSKSTSAWGLITVIDTSGNWRYTYQQFGWIRRDIPLSASYRKKLHCRNNWGVGYQGGCFGFREVFSNCV